MPSIQKPQYPISHEKTGNTSANTNAHIKPILTKNSNTTIANTSNNSNNNNQMQLNRNQRVISSSNKNETTTSNFLFLIIAIIAFLLNVYFLKLFFF